MHKTDHVKGMSRAQTSVTKYTSLRRKRAWIFSFNIYLRFVNEAWRNHKTIPYNWQPTHKRTSKGERLQAYITDPQHQCRNIQWIFSNCRYRIWRGWKNVFFLNLLVSTGEITSVRTWEQLA